MNMFTCDKCQYKAVSNNLLKTHHKYFHRNGKFTCDICGHQESRKQNLAKHKMILHEGVKYNCNQCNYQSTNKLNLDQHQRTVHEGIKFPCNHCRYEATKKGNLKEHIKSVHEGWNPIIPTTNCSSDQLILWPVFPLGTSFLGFFQKKIIEFNSSYLSYHRYLLLWHYYH